MFFCNYNYIFPSEDTLQNGPCLTEVPQKSFRYYSDGGFCKNLYKTCTILIRYVYAEGRSKVNTIH